MIITAARTSSTGVGAATWTYLAHRRRPAPAPRASPRGARHAVAAVRGRPDAEPHLLADGLVDELFLTISPRLRGHRGSHDREGKPLPEPSEARRSGSTKAKATCSAAGLRPLAGCSIACNCSPLRPVRYPSRPRMAASRRQATGAREQRRKPPAPTCPSSTSRTSRRSTTAAPSASSARRCASAAASSCSWSGRPAAASPRCIRLCSLKELEPSEGRDRDRSGAIRSRASRPQARCPCCAATSAWCSRTSSCCPTARSYDNVALRARGDRRAPRRDRARKVPDILKLVGLSHQAAPASPTSSRAASSSAWRSRARS